MRTTLGNTVSICRSLLTSSATSRVSGKLQKFTWILKNAYLPKIARYFRYKGLQISVTHYSAFYFLFVDRVWISAIQMILAFWFVSLSAELYPRVSQNLEDSNTGPQFLFCVAFLFFHKHRFSFVGWLDNWASAIWVYERSSQHSWKYLFWKKLYMDLNFLH